MSKYGFITQEAKERAVKIAGELNKLLTERISALEVGAGKDPYYTQARHAYIYYRSFLWQLMDIVGLKR
jgi:hypothetical protein